MIHEAILDVYFIEHSVFKRVAVHVLFSKIFWSNMLFIFDILLAACKSKRNHLARKSWWLQCSKRIVAANRYTGERAHFGRAHALETPLAGSLLSGALLSLPAGHQQMGVGVFTDGGVRESLGIRLRFQTIDKIFYTSNGWAGNVCVHLIIFTLSGLWQLSSVQNNLFFLCVVLQKALVEGDSWSSQEGTNAQEKTFREKSKRISVF